MGKRQNKLFTEKTNGTYKVRTIVAKVKKFNNTFWKETSLYITGRSVNWYNLCKGSLAISKLEMYILFDQTILLP